MAMKVSTQRDVRVISNPNITQDILISIGDNTVRLTINEARNLAWELLRACERYFMRRLI